MTAPATEEKRWFFAHENQPVGPVDYRQLRELARTGRVKPDSLVCQEGWPQWRPASSIPGLFDPSLDSPSAPPPRSLERPLERTDPGLESKPPRTTRKSKPPAPSAATPASVEGQFTADNAGIAEKPSSRRGGIVTAPATGRTQKFPDIPDYEIESELGRGGMGIVYKARHKKLGRLVALKMISSASQASEADFIRFLNEARSLARLQHPNIVQIYEVSEFEGQPFFSLELVEGGSLSKKMTGQPWDPDTAVAMIEKLARAVHFAHQHGIIHRDLKPGNVLLTPDGEPKLTDFGLAKNLQDTERQTNTGAVMGTPVYMAPEQARGEGHAIGTHTDVYALGVMLYELLIGEPPFTGPTAMALLYSVLEKEPQPPRRRNRRIPRDLETVCLKCLQKEPLARYSSAIELADELARFRRGEPIKARPVGAVGRLVKWARRRPALAAVYFLTLLLLTLGGLAAGAVSLWLNAEEARDQARAAHAETQSALLRVEEAKKVADAALVRVALEKTRAEDAQRREAQANQNLAQANNNLALVNYLHNVELAQRDFYQGDILRALQSLASCPQPMRSWEWHLLQRHIRERGYYLGAHPGELRILRHSPDGRFLLSGSSNREVRVWDAVANKLLYTYPGHQSDVYAVAVHPDGTQFLSAGWDRKIKLRELATGKELRTLEQHTAGIMSATFDREGKRIVSTDTSGTVLIWDLAGNSPPIKLTHAKRVDCAVFSPDGTLVATVSDDQKVRLWEADTGMLKFTMPGHTLEVYAVTFNPRGDRLLTGSRDNTLRIWDVGAGKELKVLRGHVNTVFGVDWSPDGKMIASASADLTVKLWDPESGRELYSYRVHDEVARSVQFSPDGTRVVSGGYDGQIFVWNVPGPVRSTELKTNRFQTCKDLDANGSRLAAGYREGNASVFDAGTGELLSSTQSTHNGAIGCIAFAPIGDRFVTGGDDGRVKVWDANNGRELLSVEGHASPVKAVAFSADGKRMASCSTDNKVKVFDSRSGDLVFSFEAYRGDADFPNWVAFSPDGKRLAVCGQHTRISQRGLPIKVWNLENGTPLPDLTGTRGRLRMVTFSPDSKRLAACGYDRPVKVWNLETGKLLFAMPGHPIFVNSISFNPDGSRLVSISSDGTIKLWHVGTGRHILTFRGNNRGTPDLCWSQDGRRVVVAYSDRTLRTLDGSP